MRKNRKHFPLFEPSEKGTCSLKESGALLAMKWVDKRDVHMLTTEHTGKKVDSGKVDPSTMEPVKKPDCIVDYNKNMRLVDKADQFCGVYKKDSEMV